MKVKLEKVSKNEGNLRTSTIDGFCDYLPKVGERFLMTAPPLESEDLRVVQTSIVQAVGCERDSHIEFITEFSDYCLTLQ